MFDHRNCYHQNYRRNYCQNFRWDETEVVFRFVIRRRSRLSQAGTNLFMNESANYFIHQLRHNNPFFINIYFTIMIMKKQWSGEGVWIVLRQARSATFTHATYFFVFTFFVFSSATRNWTNRDENATRNWTKFWHVAAESSIWRNRRCDNGEKSLCALERVRNPRNRNDRHSNTSVDKRTIPIQWNISSSVVSCRGRWLSSVLAMEHN